MLCIDHAAPPNPHALSLVTGPTENREGYCRGTSKGCPLSYSEACKCTHGTSAGAGSQTRGSPGPRQLSEDWGNTWIGVRGSPCMGWGAWITMRPHHEQSMGPAVTDTRSLKAVTPGSRGMMSPLRA